VVVVVGVTVVEPEAATEPTPGDIVMLLALVVFQVRIAVSPSSIEDLLVLNDLITGGWTGSGIGLGMSGG
jgi:hypothetical protein